MSNFEKRLLGKLPEYYDAGLIDAFSEQRLRSYLSAKAELSRQRFTVLPLYILAAAIAISGVFLYFRHNWENFQDASKIAIGFIPAAVSAIFGILYFVKFFKNAVFADIAAILNILGVFSAVFITNGVFNIYGDGQHAWATVILTAMPMPFIFNSSLSALLLIILTLLNGHSESGSIQNLLYFFNLILAFFIYKKSDANKNHASFVSYAALCILLPFVVAAPEKFAGNSTIKIFFAMGAAIPFLKFAKQKELRDAVAVCFSWFWIIAFIFAFALSADSGNFKTGSALSIRAFFESLKEMQNLNFLAIGSFYAANFYFVCKFFKSVLDKGANKAYIVLSSAGFFPIFIFNARSGEIAANSMQNFICAYIFLSALAFAVSAIRRKSFILLNCGSLLAAIWAASKFFNAEVDMLSASKSLFLAGVLIAAANAVLCRILKNRENDL